MNISSLLRSWGQGFFKWVHGGLIPYAMNFTQMKGIAITYPYLEPHDTGSTS